MPKIKVFTNDRDEPARWGFICPGCKRIHFVDETWKFNNDMEKPIFSPSILTGTGNNFSENRCHSFVKDGKIQFLNDSYHKLKGQTVDLPDIDERFNRDE